MPPVPAVAAVEPRPRHRMIRVPTSPQLKLVLVLVLVLRVVVEVGVEVALLPVQEGRIEPSIPWAAGATVRNHRLGGHLHQVPRERASLQHRLHPGQGLEVEARWLVWRLYSRAAP